MVRTDGAKVLSSPENRALLADERQSELKSLISCVALCEEASETTSARETVESEYVFSLPLKSHDSKKNNMSITCFTAGKYTNYLSAASIPSTWAKASIRPWNE